MPYHTWGSALPRSTPGLLWRPRSRAGIRHAYTATRLHPQFNRRNTMQVGLIGLGIMGAPMARNLLKAGFKLTTATRTPGKAEKFAAENSSLGDVKAVNTPAEVAAASEIIITMVTDSPDVVAVARGANGVFAAARPGAIIIDMSTISPQVTRELAEEARSKGLYWLDAPVSGGEKGAIEGA